MSWAEATEVLRGWVGLPVTVVPYLAPGLSVEILRGPLRVSDAEPHVVRIGICPDVAIALPRATFIEARWVPGREGAGLSVVQGGARVDVFLDGPTQA